MINSIAENLSHELAQYDSGIMITAKSTAKSANVLTEECSATVIDLLSALPYGVAAMNQNIPDLVETSNNLAKVTIADEEMSILLSIRSSVDSNLKKLCEKIKTAGKQAGAEYSENQGYPPWEPDTDSLLLKKCVAAYESLYKVKPEVLVIHAGLECGVIGDKYPDMEMISMGPTIKNAHSPRECLNLNSLAHTWDFLAALLASFK